MVSGDAQASQISRMVGFLIGKLSRSWNTRIVTETK